MTEHDDDVILPLRKPTPAKRLGRYELLDRLGRGGMGVVYRARDTKLDRPVPVKLLLGDLEGNDETRERFLREARAAADLNHRNIIQVYDFGEDGGRAFIVMELLKGTNLSELSGRGRNIWTPRESPSWRRCRTRPTSTTCSSSHGTAVSRMSCGSRCASRVARRCGTPPGGGHAADCPDDGPRVGRGRRRGRGRGRHSRRRWLALARRPRFDRVT